MRHFTLAVGFVVALGLSALLTTTTVHGQAPANRPVGHPQLQLAAGVTRANPGSGIAAAGFSSTDNLDGGFFSNLPDGVMHNARVYLIFWSPNNTINQSFKDLLQRFNADLPGTPFFNILTQYYDNDLISRDHIENNMSIGGIWTDTSTAYPHAGSPTDPITDGDIQNEVEHARSVNGWGSGIQNFFAVFTEQGIESCTGSDCTPGIDPTVGNPVFCAYHSVFFDFLSPVIYANMPFVNTWGGCRGNVNGRPNFAAAPFDPDADREISTYSHELFEAITDPLTLGTWTDPDGLSGEIADKCNQHFDSPANADGSNLTLHGNLYNVQPEWSNATMNALGGVAFGGCTHAYQPADMDIVKNAPSTVFAGASFDYTVDVNSKTSPTAETPHFTDSLAAPLTFIAITRPPDWACNTPAVGASGNVDCRRTNSSAGNDGFMTSGEAASFAVTARVSPSAPDGSTVSNTGVINWDTKYTQDLDAVSNVHLSESSTVSSTVIALADLTISKTTQGAAYAGRDFAYVIDVENDGPSDAQNVSIVDTLPAGTAFVSTAGSGGFACAPAIGTVICSKASMGAGAIAAITVTVHIPSSVASGTIITNTASVSTSTNDPNPANNTASVSAPVNTEANLSITKSGPSAPTAGTNFAYTITAANVGPSDAANVHVADTIPANTTFVGITAPAGWTCNAASPVDCTRTSFAAAATASFTLTVHLSPSVPNGTQLCNTATISTTTTDPVSSNNSSTACGTVQALADLVLTQTATLAGHPGNGTATFSLTVRNDGPSDSQNINLIARSDLFTGPPPAINVSNGGSCVVNASTVICSWNPLAVTASVQASISVPWKSAVGSVCDTATATSGTPDPNAQNNVSTVCAAKK